MPETDKPRNRLLAALSEKEYSSIRPNLELVPLVFAEDIYQPGDLIRHIYFPESGIISVLAVIEKGASLEVGIVGSEGLIGLSVFFGMKKSNNRALVQGTGVALRMSAWDFSRECDSNGNLSSVIKRFTHSLMTQISQAAVCNRYHLIESRLARWLLMTHDRMQTDEFQITQEFLSNMLGVRREAVNKAAGSLQQRQLISYSRGNLSILNRVELEGFACRCYTIIKNHYDHFLN